MSTAKFLHEQQVPDVFITLECKKKVEYIVAKSAKEVGWMGIVEKGNYIDTKTGEPIPGNHFLILKDCYVPKQEVSGATCDIDPEGISDYANILMDADQDPTTMLWWGHSHVNMGVGPSGTDMETFKEHVENLDEGQYFVMTIHNKKKEFRCNVYIGNGVYAEGVPIELDFDDSEIKAQVEQQLEENVRSKSYEVPVYRGGQRVSKSHTPNWRGPGGPVSHGTKSYSGSGSNRVESSSTVSQVGNAERNIMGLRQH